MSAIASWRAALGVASGLWLAGCTTGPSHDYGAYLGHMPVSILVLPPLDQTLEVDAAYGYLATVTRPLAERGYYVLPVALVDRIMKENGLPTAGEMHQVPLDKLREIFGADAVLYVTVLDWGTSYQVLDSSTAVGLEARLVDASTGTELWRGQARAVQSSGGGGGGLANMLANALAHQLTSSVVDTTPGLSRQANATLFGHPGRGLLLGRYHPGHADDQARRREAQAELEQARGAASSGP